MFLIIMFICFDSFFFQHFMTLIFLLIEATSDINEIHTRHACAVMIAIHMFHSRWSLNKNAFTTERLYTF